MQNYINQIVYIATKNSHFIGTLASLDEDGFIKLTPPTRELIEELPPEEKEFIIENVMFLQRADCLIKNKDVVFIKIISTTNQELTKYVKREAEKSIESTKIDSTRSSGGNSSSS